MEETESVGGSAIIKQAMQHQHEYQASQHTGLDE